MMVLAVPRSIPKRCLPNKAIKMSSFTKMIATIHYSKKGPFILLLTVEIFEICLTRPRLKNLDPKKCESHLFGLYIYEE